jgi:TRAP-type mannitol/chloroaromatic compound transport system substrate-binding protein
MSNVNRRKFLQATAAAGSAGLAGSLAAPAIAQSAPELRWRLTASWPKSLDTLYGGAEHFAKYVAEATDNKFQIQTFAAGEIVPGLQATDAVAAGTVEMCHTAPYYLWGKDPTFALSCAVPFGLNPRMQNSWWMEGGEPLVNAFNAKHNIVGLLAGNTGAQMGGWFRKELNTPDDLKGVKMRIAGFAGAVMTKVGVVPQQIAGGDIYPALEKGTIDAAEWVGPHDDEKLGFQKVAKYYYYPGWWEGCSVGSLFINKDAWEKLPKVYQSMVTTAAGLVTSWMVPKYDAENPAALKRLIASGTELRAFPRLVLEACFEAAYQFYDELAAKDAKFKKIYDHLKAFRADENVWFRVAENGFDAFNYAMSAKGK